IGHSLQQALELRHLRSHLVPLQAVADDSRLAETQDSGPITVRRNPPPRLVNVYLFLTKYWSAAEGGRDLPLAHAPRPKRPARPSADFQERPAGRGPTVPGLCRLQSAETASPAAGNSRSGPNASSANAPALPQASRMPSACLLARYTNRLPTRTPICPWPGPDQGRISWTWMSWARAAMTRLATSNL